MQSTAGAMSGINAPELKTYSGARMNATSFKVIPDPENENIAIQSAQTVTLAPAGRITVDPEVRGGVPCVGVGQWPIAHILQALGSGSTFGQVIQERPGLTLADIQLVLDVAAWVLRDPAINWAELNLPEMTDFQHELRSWQQLGDDLLEQSDNSSGD